MNKNFFLVLVSMLYFVYIAPIFAEDSPNHSAQIGIGAITMDGQTWQQVSLRPDFSIGKFGVALDLTLYIDANSIPGSLFVLS